MKKSLLIYTLAAMAISGCSSDNDAITETVPETATYKIINNGAGSVTTINPVGDDSPLAIAQAIPSVSGNSYPSNVPIVFFMNDKIYLPSISTETFKVSENGVAVGGTVSVNESRSNGFAIITFVPKHQFKSSANISITLTSELKDDAGNGIAQDVNINYTTSALQSNGFDTNGGFENGNDGVTFIGDGNIMTSPQGCMGALGGSNFGAISTGAQLVSTETAIGEASSIMIVGPVTNAISSVTFNYNFLSAEFQEYVGSEFDDSFVAIVYGDDGAYTELITSVNLIGLDGNTQCTGFPGMSDAGDDYYGFTGWISKTLTFPSVGANAHVIFVATDVTDQIYSTIVGIDDISFGN